MHHNDDLMLLGVGKGKRSLRKRRHANQSNAKDIDNGHVDHGYQSLFSVSLLGLPFAKENGHDGPNNL